MAGVGLLALLDDIATVLDDVALMTKVAAKKTAGVLGDDLALNAQQVSGVASERELPVVWGVAKGSLLNKVILIPTALLLSAFLPMLIQPLLMVGGAYLCYEGAEKIFHHIFHRFFHHEPQKCSPDAPAGDTERHPGAAQTPEASPAATTGEEDACIDLSAYEKIRIKGAVRTDFILSAEIIVIALGSVPAGTSFITMSLMVCLIGFIMTVGVYGLVAVIVKLDDLGFFLTRACKKNGIFHRIGGMLIHASPVLMRLLGIVGTIAMFTVGGQILAHGIPAMHTVSEAIATLPAAAVIDFAASAVFGIFAGGIALAVITAATRAYAVVARKG